MTGTPPDRELKQRMDALERANEIRTKRAKLKQDLKAGRGPTLAELVEHPPDWLHTAKLFEILLAVPKLGRVKVNRLFVAERISPSKTFAGLSQRQRDAVARRIVGRYSVDPTIEEAA